MTALFVVATIVTLLTIDYFIKKREAPAAGKSPLLSTPVPAAPAIYFRGMPKTAFLHPGHTWLTLRDTGTVRVGIDSFATEALGKRAALELPKVATRVRAGEPIMSVNLTGRRATFVAPVDGEVVKVNERASSKDLPREWLIEIRPKHLGEQLRHLHLAESAHQWLDREWARFKDFLAATNGDAALALQDGGEPVPGILANAGDETWESFQRNFLSRT